LFETLTCVPSSHEIVEDFCPCSSITITASGNYPFGEGIIYLWGALVPNVDYSVRFTMCPSSRRPWEVYIVADGSHNAFPNYEALVDGQNIYRFATQESGPGIVSLNSSVTFTSEGVHVAK